MGKCPDEKSHKRHFQKNALVFLKTEDYNGEKYLLKDSQVE